MNTPKDSILPVVQPTQSSLANLDAEIASALKSTPPSRSAPKPTIEDTLQARNKVHGDYSTDAMTSQMLKDIIHNSDNWRMMNHVQRESLEHICTKMGRICVGDPNHKDHWDDISGYATLVSQRL